MQCACSSRSTRLWRTKTLEEQKGLAKCMNKSARYARAVMYLIKLHFKEIKDAILVINALLIIAQIDQIKREKNKT